ncbi:MAG TPA: DUF971 domain-containing protein [Pseudomonadales bacterium]|nr:DUF971 domain-containing protein [Pseudomonadales bacterium]
MNAQVPIDIRYHRQSRTLELCYADGISHLLGSEFLRVHSPSAEVQGHGEGQQVLQTGKRNVGITMIEPAGNYAIRLAFDDGHDSGIYTWSYLHDIAMRQETLWQEYLQRLEAAGASRGSAH